MKFNNKKPKLENLLSTLTPIEKSILLILVKTGGAIHANRIRELLITDAVFSVLCRMSEFEKELRRAGVTPENTPIFWLDLIKPPKKLDEFVNFARKTPLTELDKYARELKRQGMAKIPDYKTIQKILYELTATSLVVSRSEVGGKAKTLYAINPKIKDELARILEEERQFLKIYRQ